MKGKLLKKWDVVYSTKSGRTMIAKSIMATTATAAKNKVKQQMRASTSFKKIMMAIERD